MKNDQHVLDWLPAYGLGVLDGEELHRVAEHLEACSMCRAELASFQETIDQIPLTVPMVRPPARVKWATLARVTQPKAERIPWFKRLQNRLSQPVPVWSLAAIGVMVIALLVGGAVLWEKNQQLAQAQKEEFKVVELNGSTANPAAYGWIVVSQDGRAGTMIVEGLPALTDNQSYQLWLYKDGQSTSGGTFWVDQNGYASLWVNSPLPLVDYQKFRITAEPYQGSPQPTGPVVISGKF